MSSTKKVQNTHIRNLLRQLHAAIIEIVTPHESASAGRVFDQKEAGIASGSGAIPFACQHPAVRTIGGVELADRLRDATTPPSVARSPKLEKSGPQQNARTASFGPTRPARPSSPRKASA